jgi:hypothetical protein
MFNAVFGNGSVTLTQAFRDSITISRGNLTNKGVNTKLLSTPSLDEELVLYSTLFKGNSKETPLLPGLSVYSVVGNGIQHARPTLFKYMDYSQVKYCGMLTIFNPSYKPAGDIKIASHYDKIYN